MTPERRKRIIDKHCDAWNRHGYSPNALYLSDTDIQQLRFRVLSAIIDQPQYSLLDVGCGFGNLRDLNPADNAFDYVLLSGALNEKMNDDGSYAKSVIRRMYQCCRQSVAFNLLNRHDAYVAGRWDLQTFEPDEIVEFCQQLGAACEVKDDYMENNFIVYLRKSALGKITKGWPDSNMSPANLPITQLSEATARKTAG